MTQNPLVDGGSLSVFRGGVRIRSRSGDGSLITCTCSATSNQVTLILRSDRIYQ